MADLVPQSGLPEEAAPSNLVPDNDLPDNLSQQPVNNDASDKPVLAATEGAMRGMTRGLSDVVFKGARHLAENITDDPQLQDFIAPKISDVAARSDTTAAKVGEGAGILGGFLTGSGAPGAIAKGAKAIIPEATGVLAGIGSAVLRGGLESMAVQAGDELSRTMLGKGDPENAVGSAIAHIGGAGLIGAFTGGVFNGLGQGVNKGLAAIENAKMGNQANNLLAGMGVAAKAHAAGVPIEKAEEFAQKYFHDLGEGDLFNYNNYKDGVNLYYKGLQKIVNKAASMTVDTAAGILGAKALGPIGGYYSIKAADNLIAPVVEKILKKPLIGLNNKLVLPTVMKALSEGKTLGLFNALNYATKISKGAQAVNKGVESLFKTAGNEAVNYVASDKDKQSIKDYIDDGGVNKEMHDSLQVPDSDMPQGYAKGGAVQQDADAGSVNSLYPEQSMLMSAAKGRMSNYLGSLKPQENPQKLPYDRAPIMTEQHKKYNNAIEIAAQPLSILNHIKKGTLRVEHIQHMNSMYPELTQHLQKKLTQRMMQSQLDEEAPSGKTKQSLALFLSSPLATYMTPQGIMAAQSTFAPRQTPQQGQQQSKNKKGTSNLGKSNKSYETADQSAESDRSGRKA